MLCGGSPATGGWSFAADPDTTAAAAPALWQPRACAHVTIARPAPKGFAALRLGEVAHGAHVAAELLAWKSWHLVLASGGRHYRLAIRRCTANERLAFVIPADDRAAFRAAHLGDLHRELLGLAPRAATADDIGPTARWRLIQWLRLLDALEERASPRAIASALLLADAADFSAAEWDASSERRRLARWQRAAIAMRDGGFAKLLAAP